MRFYLSADRIRPHRDMAGPPLAHLNNSVREVGLLGGAILMQILLCAAGRSMPAK